MAGLLPEDRIGDDTTRPQLLALTSLRFFAALLVVGFHAASARDAPLAAPRWLMDLLSNGYNAVSLFFVLSGFVLAYIYSDTESNDGFRGTIRAYAAARFARIYPVYAVGLVIALPAFVYSAFAGLVLPIPTFVLTAAVVPLLIQAWFPPLALTWNSPAWSLSVEAFLYACLPLALRMMRALRTGPVLALCIAAAALIAACEATILGAGAASDTNLHNFVSYFPVLFLPHFLFGVALGCAFVSGTRCQAKFAALLFIGSATAILLLFSNRSLLPWWLLSDPVLIPLYGLLIYGAAVAPAWATLGLLSWPMVILGEASYALYILHAPIGFWWGQLEDFVGVGHFHNWVNVSAFVLAAVLVSIVVFVGIERPARRWLRRRLAA